LNKAQKKRLPDGQIRLILGSMATHPKRPRDPNQLAKAIVDIATGHAQPDVDTDQSEASKFARIGGLKGGKARAEKLSAQRRQEIAREAAAKRWRKDDS
jgi:hypothetical protein